MKEALNNLFRCVLEMTEAQSVAYRARRDYEENKNGETLLGWHRAQKALDEAKETYNAAAAICDGLAGACIKEQVGTIFLVQESFSDGCTYNNEVPLAGFAKEALADAACADMTRRAKDARNFSVLPITVYAFGDPAAVAKTILRDNPK